MATPPLSAYGKPDMRTFGLFKVNLQLPVFYENIIISCLQKTLPVTIHKSKITVGIDLKAEHFGLSGLDRLFLKKFQLFHGARNRTNRIADKPMHRFHPVAVARIGQQQPRRSVYHRVSPYRSKLLNRRICTPYNSAHTRNHTKAYSEYPDNVPNFLYGPEHDDYNK